VPITARRLVGIARLQRGGTSAVTGRVQLEQALADARDALAGIEIARCLDVLIRLDGSSDGEASVAERDQLWHNHGVVADVAFPIGPG
jgi:hypothetical protein